MIRLSAFFKFIIILCSLVMLRYPFLLPESMILGGNTQKGLVAVAGILLAGLTIFAVTGKTKAKQYFKWLSRYLLPYLTVLVFSTFYTCVLYGYTLKSVLVSLFPFLYVFFALPLIYIFYYDDSCIRFLRVVCVLQVIMLVIKAIIWYAYNFMGRDIFPKLLFEFGTWRRNGLQRVEQGQLFGLALVIFVFIGIEKKLQIKYILIIIGAVSFVALISASRYSVICAIATVFVMCYFTGRRGMSKIIMRTILWGGGIALFLTGVVERLIESASITGKYAKSTLARIQNLEHYFDIMRKGHYLLGLGLLNASNVSAYQLFYKSQTRLHYLDDVGIIGGVVRFGVFSLVIYGLLFGMMCKTCWSCYQKKEYSYFSLIAGLTVYVILSCLISNIFDGQRAFAIPFYLATFSYVDAKISLKAKVNGE